MKKKKEPKLYPACRSMSKDWYVGYHDEFGKPKKKYGKLLQMNTLEERLQEGYRLLEEVKKEQSISAGTSMNGELIRHLQYAVDARCQGKKQKTKDGYSSKLNIFARWYREAHCPPVSYLMGNAFLTWVGKKTKAKANTSINGYRRQLKTFFGDLVEQEIISTNPFDKTKKLPQRTSTKKWFREHEQKELKNLILEGGEQQLWLCCLLQFYCFIRPGEEMRYIKVSDIIRDQASWKVRVNPSSAKTGRPRTIPVPDTVKEYLQPYLIDACENDYLFSVNERPGTILLGRDHFYKRHRKYMQYLSLGPGHSLYSWKNTGAVMMVRAGMKIKYISMLMGHSSIETTDIYLKSLGIDDVLEDVQLYYPQI